VSAQPGDAESLDELNGLSATGLEPTTGLLVRNTLVNVVGQVLPLVVAVATIPYVVRGLGPERFGLLSLAWVILGYSSVFDLGLGRATTKYVAELMARGDHAGTAHIVWASVVCQLVMGLLGAAILALAGPALVTGVFRIPEALATEARATVSLLGVGLPAILASNSLSGALEARQRFDLANIAKLLASTGNYLVPMLGVLAGATLPEIVGLTMIWRWMCLGLLLAMNARSGLKLRAASFRRAPLRKLASFGVWVTISALIVPATVYLDRVLIARLTSLQALAYYSVAYDLTSKLLFVSGAAAAAAFPALSATSSNETTHRILAQSTRMILVGLGLPCALLVGYAEPVLALWAGPEIADSSAAALRVLALATLINGLGFMPYALVEAKGFPQVVTVYHVIELPLYGTVTYLLVREMGIKGAAVAWLLRMLVTIPLFSLICGRIAGVEVGRVVLGVARCAGAVGLVMVLLMLAGRLTTVSGNHATALVSILASTVASWWVLWRWGLGTGDRAAMRGALLGLRIL
jgi:O-antigen/teichoic acid export membrane protein